MNKKKLKIGIVIDQLLAGGVQLTAIEQVKELNKLGHNAKLLILMRKQYSTNFSYLVSGIPHQYLSDTYPKLFRNTVKFPIFSFLSTLHLMSPLLAPKVIKKGEYDVLISHGTTTCLTTQAIYHKHKLPYLAVIHDPIEYILEKAYAHTSLRYFFLFLKPLSRYFENSFIKDAKKTIIISTVHYNYLESNYNITPEILIHGTKTLIKLPKKRGDELLSFGRWQKEKNPQLLLKLLKILKNSKLTIAGSWTDLKDLKEFENSIIKEDLQKRVTLVPHFDEKTLTTLCKNARLFLHPHFEAFGLAALEAAGQGLPIIIPQKSGVTELFHHGIDGFFPTKVDLEEYKNYVNILLHNERKAYSMGVHGWKTVKGKLSWQANTKQLLEYIYQVIPCTEEKTKIFIIETGHALHAPLSGGDKLMEPMALRLTDVFKFSVIVSSIGASHWQHAPLQKEMTILKRNRFDESGNPIPLFLTYCIRMWQTYRNLKEKINKQQDASLKDKKAIIYSSTNILPDVLPAYFIKKEFPDLRWIARVHHLIPTPNKREGNIFVNIVSYLMQNLSLSLMKSAADLTIALNIKLQTDLQNLGFEKVKVLGGGIDFDDISSRKPEKIIRFNAVFLGRLHITKGVFDTIPIWKEVTKIIPHATLAIIGDGPEELKKSLLKKIEHAGLSKNIIFLKFLPYEKVYSIMKQADIFLFLDHEAGWGLAVAEAMACSLPVIGYDNGVLGNVYKSGFILAPIGNYKYVSQQIVKLLEDKKLHQKLANEASLEAAKHDWNNTSSKFRQLVEDILSDK